jgi:hypothetical protein
VKLTTHLQLVLRSRKCGSIHLLPLCLHGIVLNYLTTVTTLPFFYLYLDHEDVGGGSGAIATSFLTWALDGGEWSDSRPCHSTPRDRAPGIHWIAGLAGPRASLDAVEKRKILCCQNRTQAVQSIIKSQSLCYCLFSFIFHGPVSTSPVIQCHIKSAQLGFAKNARNMCLMLGEGLLYHKASKPKHSL